MRGALSDFTVLDLTTGSAGALCTELLAEHGATVARVVDASAPDLRAGGFVIWDRGKLCVRIDLDAVVTDLDCTTAASLAFMQLVRGADVVIDDWAPADARQRLVAPDWLQRLNPLVVCASITAYGKTGPWRDEPAIDELVLARTGVLGGLPGYRAAPVHLVHPLPSVGASALASLGITAALYAREEDAQPHVVETSLMAGALLYHPKVTAERLDHQTFQTEPSGSAPFYSVYQCADGRWLQLGCVHQRFITIAGDVLGIGDTLKAPRFGGGRAPTTPKAEAELRALLRSVMASRSSAEWMRAFEQADVPFAQSRWTEDALDDPQLIHNNMIVELDDPAHGMVKQMGVGLTLTKTPGAVPGPRQRAGALNDVPASWPAHRTVKLRTATGLTLGAPLADTRVLEITNLIAGPTAGRLLADLGADVIKLEPLTGDMSRPIGRSYFYSVNFNKRSISIDTGTDAGKRIVQGIAASADAMVANLRPHATERMGIVPANNPELIETHITGYGWTGPYAHRPGIDPLAQAMLGLERAQGGHHNPPVFPAQLAPTDFTTGAMAAFGTVLALLARRRHGEVQRVESNLLYGGVLLTSEWFSSYAGRAARPLADRMQYGLHPLHRLYQTVDGWVYAVARSSEALSRLCQLLEVDAAALDGTPPALDADHANESALAVVLAGAMARLSSDDALELLSRAGIFAAPAMAADSGIFLAGTHANESASVAYTKHPQLGAMRVATRYVRLDGGRPDAGLPTPLLGEHTADVAQEIGLPDADIERLYAEGVVKTEMRH
jgi:crotonobetainyl-CoA:carnitine CoA-transferase CaiB-like acyl-CoA transferase